MSDSPGDGRANARTQGGEAPVTEALVRALPKTDLHCHLDGSLRLSTILELAEAQGVELPAHDESSLARALHVGERRASLVQYLAAFDVTLSVLQTGDALRRAAYELAVDAHEEGVRWLEVRYAPLLHRRGGLALEEIVDAVLDGLRAAKRDTGIDGGVIVCALRDRDPADSLRMAELAVAHAHRGVCGFDLAGPERGFPAERHRAAFRHALEHGVRTTCHAGEADGPASIAQAIHRCGAQRIGHGVRLHEDAALQAYVNEHRIPLESCPSSNVQTGAVPDLESHPVGRYVAEGLRVTVNTDNRLLGDATVTGELMRLHRRCGLGLDELIRCVVDGWKSAFLPDAEKPGALARVEAEIDAVLRRARSVG